MGLVKSWFAPANVAGCPFPLNNLPYGVFSISGAAPRCGVALGDHVFDLTRAEADGVISVGSKHLFQVPAWNTFMASGRGNWDRLREILMKCFQEGALQQDILRGYLKPLKGVDLHIPFQVAEFTDFYACKHHAMNVGTMFRGPENALPPNWLDIPIGYNGRASSVVVSGTDIVRPNGQTKGVGDDLPTFGQCKRLDIELELGAIVGTATALGETVSVEQADDMIFGYVLLNDWSARDIQAWEYQPLGPFQGKAFATSISPWIVSSAALESFRTSTPARERDLLPYLREPKPMLFDIELSVMMQPDGGAATKIAETNYNQMYYSAPQQLAHHASSGCPMSVGDLLGSGTISGPEKSQRGCLLELTWGGKEPLTLDCGAVRTFIEDGDTLILTGAAIGQGFQIGFGSCSGTIRPVQN